MLDDPVQGPRQRLVDGDALCGAGQDRQPGQFLDERGAVPACALDDRVEHGSIGRLSSEVEPQEPLVVACPAGRSPRRGRPCRVVPQEPGLHRSTRLVVRTKITSVSSAMPSILVEELEQQRVVLGTRQSAVHPDPGRRPRSPPSTERAPRARRWCLAPSCGPARPGAARFALRAGCTGTRPCGSCRCRVARRAASRAAGAVRLRAAPPSGWSSSRCVVRSWRAIPPEGSRRTVRAVGHERSRVRTRRGGPMRTRPSDPGTRSSCASQS